CVRRCSIGKNVDVIYRFGDFGNTLLQPVRMPSRVWPTSYLRCAYSLEHDPDRSAWPSPRVSHRSGAGVGGGVVGELAVEFGEQHDAAGEAILGALRHE